MLDQCGRKIDYMRISVTDRCNLRCVYCMPKEGIKCIGHDEILTYDEILRIVKAGASLGIEKIKVTGGEPLVRKGIVTLVRMIKQTPGIKTVTLTTNGVLFSELGEQLSEAGLDGVNFSLDSLDARVFAQLTRVDALDKVKQGIDTALRLGLKTKLNCVPIDTYNGAELAEIAALAKDKPVDVRFIEMMPIGLGHGFETMDNAVVMEKLVERFGQPKRSAGVHGNGPAVYYDFPKFEGSIGFISAVSNTFCAGCNRIRLTADGVLKPCLCYGDGLPLKPLLRNGISDSELTQEMRHVIENKPREHQLCEAETTETRKMVQIGG
jgi:cyclic pyranopterin phosphate synthase